MTASRRRPATCGSFAAAPATDPRARSSPEAGPQTGRDRDLRLPAFRRRRRWRLAGALAVGGGVAGTYWALASGGPARDGPQRRPRSFALSDGCGRRQRLACTDLGLDPARAAAGGEGADGAGGRAVGAAAAGLGPERGAWMRGGAGGGGEWAVRRGGVGGAGAPGPHGSGLGSAQRTRFRTCLNDQTARRLLDLVI